MPSFFGSPICYSSNDEFDTSTQNDTRIWLTNRKHCNYSFHSIWTSNISTSFVFRTLCCTQYTSLASLIAIQMQNLFVFSLISFTFSIKYSPSTDFYCHSFFAWRWWRHFIIFFVDFPQFLIIQHSYKGTPFVQWIWGLR